MKCEKCGSDNVIEGKLSTGLSGLLFTTKNPRKNFLLQKITLY